MTRYPLVWLSITTGREPAATSSLTSNIPLPITIKRVLVAVA
jgi:hypothetical protein